MSKGYHITRDVSTQGLLSGKLARKDEVQRMIQSAVGGGADFFEIEEAEIVEVGVDEDTLPKLPDKSGPDYSMIGAVRCRRVYTDKGKADGELVWIPPLQLNTLRMPVIGEYVTIVSYLGFPFWSTDINVVRSQNNSIFPGLSKTGETSAKYSEGSDASEISATGTPNVAGSGNEFDTGLFTSDQKIKNLQPLTGDFILTGRYGNSIRLGGGLGRTESGNKVESLAPSIKLRVGQLSDDDSGVEEDSNQPIFEDINLDGSSLYMLTNETISFNKIPITFNNTGIDDVFPQSNEMIGRQVIINTGAITYQAKDGDFMCFSKGRFGVECEEDLLLETTGKFIVGTAEIFLGSQNATEPLILGDTLQGLLEDLIGAINALTVPTPVGPSGPPINAAQFSSIQSKLSTMLSTKVKSE